MYQKRYIVKRVGILDSCRSSSRLRGTPLYIHVTGPITRFIPAFAGNAQCIRGDVYNSTVHPRVCGERQIPYHLLRPDHGSSPRLRGTHVSPPRGSLPSRFIPAFAGNTCIPKREETENSVHPRVCGEHTGRIGPVTPVTGSSPRLRGTHKHGQALADLFRFIPAFAGNTTSWTRACSPRPVHPRVCGEHSSSVSAASIRAGSSPRLRGTPADETERGRADRFIPAFAGNTETGDQGRVVVTVHPRVCGEHGAAGGSLIGKGGSSPRLRGTPVGDRVRVLVTRFIPAFAGNTTGAKLVDGIFDGSSPRLRGTRPRSARSVRSRRFIPAFAGNTAMGTTRALMPPVHPRVCGEHVALACRQ